MAPNEQWGLVGKVAIVAGGGSEGDGIGNGRGSSIMLARAGAHVLVVDQHLDRAERTVAMIAEEGGSAAAASYDLMNSAQCAAMVEDAVARWGRLDCLHNNVGFGIPSTVVDSSEEDWDRVIQGNLRPVFLASKHAIPAMIRGGGGAVVNTSSVSSLRPHGFTSYTAVKGAVNAVTKSMAVDHGPQGVRVNCVIPGPMYTPVVYMSAAWSENLRDSRRKASVLEREGTGWDIGSAALFLLSDLSRFITGQLLVVDGGVSLVSRARAPGNVAKPAA